MGRGFGTLTSPTERSRSAGISQPLGSGPSLPGKSVDALAGGLARCSRRSSTTSSSAGSTRRCRGSSSSTAQRPCPRRSAEPSTVPRRSNAVRSTRRATSWSDCPNRCTPRSAACCDKHGSSTTPTGPKSFIRNLAQRLERDWSGVAGSILEGVDEILTVTRLGLPKELRRSLACTNIIENVMSTVRRVCRNVKRWRSASMAMRWTAAAMKEAAKGFRRLKAHKQLPALRAALHAHQNKNSHGVLARQANAA